MRWKVEFIPADIARFRRECLDPILEQLCDWWEYIVKREDPFSPERKGLVHVPTLDYGIHWRHPFGVWNSLNEGRAPELDEYLATGSTLGLTRVDNLFPELD